MNLKVGLPVGAFLALVLMPGGWFWPSAAAVVIRGDRNVVDALTLAEPFHSAGRVLPDGGCTLIAPNWALTAAHVAATVKVGGRVQFGDDIYTVKSIIIHPDGIAPAGRPPEVDLALLELDDVVRGVIPADLYRGKSEIGKRMVLVGYGDFGQPGSKLTHADGKRRAVSNLVDDAGPKRIFMKFDAPPAGTEFEGVGGPGDSGGPAFLDEAGKRFVAGVSSASMDGKPGQYGVTDVYTRVSSYAQWIDRAMVSRPTHGN